VVSYDEYYNDPSRMMLDAAKLLNKNFKRLAEAGCKHIQIDEPYLTPPSDDEVRTAVEAINLAIEGLPPDVHVAVHVCQGNYAVGAHYDGQIGHRYFDTGRYKADLICQIDCDSYLIEHDRTDAFKGLLGNKQLGVGAVDVQAPNVETAEVQSADRVVELGACVAIACDLEFEASVARLGARSARRFGELLVELVAEKGGVSKLSEKDGDARPADAKHRRQKVVGQRHIIRLKTVMILLLIGALPRWGYSSG
jgi:hypothetical protein